MISDKIHSITFSWDLNVTLQLDVRLPFKRPNDWALVCANLAFAGSGFLTTGQIGFVTIENNVTAPPLFPPFPAQVDDVNGQLDTNGVVIAVSTVTNWLGFIPIVFPEWRIRSTSEPAPGGLGDFFYLTCTFVNNSVF